MTIAVLVIVGCRPNSKGAWFRVVHFDTSGLEDAAAELMTKDIDVLRVGYADLIGSERGRDVLVNRFARTVGSGVAFCRSVFGTTPMGDVVDIEGGLEAGLPDVLAFPDISTLQTVPWEPGVAHVIADMFNPDGTPSAEVDRRTRSPADPPVDHMFESWARRRGSAVTVAKIAGSALDLTLRCCS